MILRFLKRTGPGVLFVIIIILSAVWAGAFLIPHSPGAFNYETNPMPLYRLLKFAVASNYLYGLILTVILVAIIAVLLVRLDESGGLSGERSFLPALIYILFTAFFPQYQLLNPVLPASLFLLLAITRIMDGYNKPGTVYNFFDAGFLISVGSLFYSNLIWFGLLVFIGIAILKTGNITELAISVTGLVTPYFLTFGILYVAGSNPQELFNLIVKNLFVRTEFFHFSFLSILPVFIVSAGVLASIGKLFRIMSTKKIKSRKIFSLFLSTFLISIAVLIFVPSASIEMIWLISLPASYFLSFIFVSARTKFFPELYFIVLLLIVFFIQTAAFK
jgi:hypothetical protein